MANEIRIEVTESTVEYEEPKPPEKSPELMEAEDKLRKFYAQHGPGSLWRHMMNHLITGDGKKDYSF